MLIFAGLRITELCELHWRSVDLATGWVHVQKSKMDAGIRSVRLRGALREELAAIRPVDADPDAYVFATSTGGQQNPSNLRNRVLGPAAERASATLTARGLSPLQAAITPHSLRRTFASVLFAIGEPHPIVMQEMGHEQPTMTLGLYAQAMRCSDAEKARLQALVEGPPRRRSGRYRQSHQREGPSVSYQRLSGGQEVHQVQALPTMDPTGIEPVTSCVQGVCGVSPMRVDSQNRLYLLGLP